MVDKPSRLWRRMVHVADLPRTYWFLWAGTIVNRLGGFVIPFLTLYLTSQRGMPVSQAALMVSLFGTGSFAASLVGGELADRLGRRPVLLMSLLLAPPTMLAVGMARTLPQIAAATSVLGFFTDLYRPAVNAAVADLVPAEARPRAYGYLYWAINVGAAVAPVLAGFMTRWNYFLLFAGNALATLMFGLLVLLSIPETRPATVGQRASLSMADRAAALRRDPLLLAFAALALVFGTIYQQGYVTLPVDMRGHGLTPEQYGLAISLNGALIVLAGIPASNTATRWPRFGAMAAASLLLGLGFGMPSLASTLGLYALSIAIWTVGEILGATIAPAIVADLAPADMRGLYQGVFGAAWGLSFFTGPVLGGWIYQELGSHALWLSCLVVGVLLSLGYLGMARIAKRRLFQGKGGSGSSAARADA